MLTGPQPQRVYNICKQHCWLANVILDQNKLCKIEVIDDYMSLDELRTLADQLAEIADIEGASL